jgi:hypothetical protein
MRTTLLLIASIAVTVLCWGSYGVALHHGSIEMALVEGTRAPFRPFVCLGIAYFLIGVVVPAAWLYFRGEQGGWTISGVLWSLLAGALGAIGALGIVLAFAFGGRPVYVMPLVFGGAPVVNAFLTIYLAGRLREIGPVFLAGLIMVVLGAVTVLVFAPRPTVHADFDSTFWDWLWRVLVILLTVVSWGSYGPALHKGQMAMHRSRMRPLLCVGMAYLVIAVVVTNLILLAMPEASSYTLRGTLWSLLGGAVGAVGAIGIIMAFNFGGRPVFVMPLVFGGAPIVNTFVTMEAHGLGDVNPFFYAGLILAIAGSSIVLVFAPRGEGGHVSQEPRVKSHEPEPAAASDERDTAIESGATGEPLARG